MKKNYFLIIGILILLIIGGYFGVQEYLNNSGENIIETYSCKKDCKEIILRITSIENYPILPDKILIKSNDDKDIYYVDSRSPYTGIYRIKLEKRKYSFIISAEGYQSLEHEINIDDGMDELSFTLIPNAGVNYKRTILKKPNQNENLISVNGFVINQFGEPTSNTSVSNENYDGKEYSTLTNKDGYYELDIPFNETLGIKKIDILYSDKSKVIKTVSIWSEKGLKELGLVSINVDSNINLPMQKIFKLSLSDFFLHKQSQESFTENLRVGVNCTGDAFSCTSVIVVPIEIYVRNVLSNEWVPSWGNYNGDDSFSSGAIAIRSYAKYHLNNPITSTYDICNTTYCQVYDPANDSGSSQTNLSVINTEEWVLINSGQSIVKSEFAAEINDNPTNPSGCNYPYWGECGDGYFQKSVNGPPCNNGDCWPQNGTVDFVSLGKFDSGSHPRGLSQRGSFRWSSGFDVQPNNIPDDSQFILPSTYQGIDYCVKSWQEIIAHYYPYYNLFNEITNETIDLSSGYPNSINNCNIENNCTDNYEPNDIQSQATPLYVFGHDFSWSDSLVDECLDQATADIDWYRMNLTHQGELTITLSSQQISSLFMDWLDNGNVTSSTTVNGNKQIVICSNNGPACYDTALRIYTVTQNGNDPIPYTLDIQWSANQSCSSGRQSNTNNTTQNSSTIKINGNTSVCEGLSNTLSASGASGPFDWFVNGQSVHIGNTFNTQSLNTGQYDLFVIATDDVCSFAEAQLNITSGVTANAGSNVTIQANGSTTLQGSGGTSCSWSPTTGLSNPNSCTPTASPSQTTTYTLTVTENGCTDTDTVTITVNGSNGNPPPNDNCSNATTLNSNTSCNFTSGTVENATPSVGANHCDGCSCTSPDDYDVYYKFTAIKTSHTVTVSNYASNFDAVIELRTSCSSGSSNYISCYDPSGAPTSVSETWDNLNIGQTYYIRVFEWNYQGTPPNANTFNICVTHNNTGGQGIDLISNITSVSDSNPDVGDSIDVTFTITNNGDENVNDAFVGGLYLSTNQTYSSSDDIFSGSTQGFTAISSGQTLTINKTITIPNVSDGQYYILSNPDIGNNIIEIEEDNNYSSYLIQIGQIVQNGPDLDITGMSVTPNSGLVPGQEVTIELDIENEGNEDSSSFDVLIFLDIDGDNDYDSNEFMGEFNFGSLDAGEDNTITQGFDLPANIPSTGVYELFAIADSNNAINETDEGNNDKDRNITIALASGGSEDITVINSSVAESSVNAGGTINVISNHIYLGNQTSSELPTLHLGYYLSADCDFSYAEDVFLDDDSSNLGINNPNIEEDEILTIPPATSSGTYYILFVADSENLIDEGTLENNNVECIQITVNGTSTPEGDIFITDELCNPTDVIIGSELEVFYNLNYAGNQTNVDLPSIEVFYFLSNDCGLSNDDILVSDDSISLGSDLPVNDVDERIELPNNLSAGTYYIIFRADMENAVYEVNENNNTACVEFNLLPADASYQDVTLSSPYVEVTEANVGDQVYVSVYQNYTGYQTDADLSSVQMQYYLSTDCTLSSDDYHFGNDYSSIGSDDPSQFEYDTVTIPSGISLGIYYILFVADTENIVNENNENNNLECIQIIINDDALGIDDNELNNQIKIYPNPVSDILTINLGKTHSEISLEIYNVVGQRIRTSEYNNKRILTINTSSFSNGIYFFKIKTDTIKSKEFKIIKE